MGNEVARASTTEGATKLMALFGIEIDRQREMQRTPRPDRSTPWEVRITPWDH